MVKYKDIGDRLRLDDGYRDSLLTWLRANGVDARHVPHDARPTFVDGRMTLQVYKLGEDGARQLDPMKSDELARVTVTVDLAVPPTPDVLLWATPPCPTCGR